MPILGKLLKEGIKIRQSVEQEKHTPLFLQKKELKKLLLVARSTAFGKHYQFEDILNTLQNTSKHSCEFYELFKTHLPVHDYQKMYDEWWYRAKNGEKDVCWKNNVKYFALSSGTSDASSKYIPVTKDMIRAIRKTSIRQIFTLSKYQELPSRLFQTGMLMLGGSTHLNFNGNYFEGDLSGITAAQIPFWFQHFYKPGKKIAKTTDWEEKLNEITVKAPKWNIGFVVGVPAWIQIMMEKIIDYHKVSHIHEIWPNLMVYTHGGVSFEPYKKGFEKLLGKPLTYIETYLASEGFIAYQARPDGQLQLVLNNGIFFEFIPFNTDNFSAEGKVKEDPETYMLHEIEENKDYALLISTCSGAWRYLIGDVVRLVDKEKSEIVITGRTKHFLSLCGEHLSVDNMNKAIEIVSEEMGINIKEFTVAGINYQTLFAHQWFLGVDEEVDKNLLKSKLDEKLMLLNDDYKVERNAALKEVFIQTVPTELFYKWMKMNGKEGGQNKFPRVIKGNTYEEWISYLKKESQ